MMEDMDRIQEIKDRLADKFTASELCDLLDIPVEDLIEEYWDRILSRPSVLQEVECNILEEDEE